MKIDSEALLSLIEEEAKEMSKLPYYTRCETVIGEVKGQVVLLTVMSKAEATDEFNGDWTNLEIVNDTCNS